MKTFLQIPSALLVKVIVLKDLSAICVNNNSEYSSAQNLYGTVLAGFDQVAVISVIISAVISFLFLAFYKKRNNSKKEYDELKNNVSLLRTEKLGSYNDIKLQNKRRKIINDINVDEANLNSLFIKKAKKLGLSTGDLILASKIQLNAKILK